MKQRKQLLNPLGLLSPQLSQHLLRLLLLLVTAIGGVGSSWAEEETPGNTGTADTELSGTSYSIASTYIAGSGSAKVTPMETKGVKIRTNKNSNLVFSVKPGHKITGLTIYGISNSDKTTVTVSSATVDGGSNLLGSEVVLPLNTSTTAGTISLPSISATNNITLTFGSGSNSQANIDIYVTYEEISGYTVTYNTNGGTQSEATSVTEQTALPAIFPIPTKDGYAFGGWYTDEGCTALAVKETAISANTTLYALWIAKGNTTNELVEIPIGTTIKLVDYVPNTPSTVTAENVISNRGFEVANRIFANDYLQYQSTGGYNIKGAKTYEDGSIFTPVLDIKDNRKLTFKLPANCKLTVYGNNPGSDTRTWDLKKGSETIISSRPADYFSCNITEEGTYTLLTTGSNVTLQLAAIKVSPITNTVTFNAGDKGKCATPSLTQSEVGASITLPGVTPKADNTFLGWSTNPEATVADANLYSGWPYTPTNDVTLYAVYRTAGLVFGDAHSGWWENFSRFDQLVAGRSHGYTFTMNGGDTSYKNWVLIATNNTGHNGDGVQEGSSNELFCLRADGHYWGNVSSTKMYVYDGSKYVETIAIDNADFITAMANATVKFTASRVGKRIYIYVTTECTNGAKYVEKFTSGEISGDVYLSFTAQNSTITFSEAPVDDAYLVKYSDNANGTADILSAEGISINNTAVIKGTSVSFTATPTEGYSFVNWTGTNYAEVSKENPYTVTVSSALDLTPNFEADAVSHTITFNANGGKGTMDPQQVEDNVATAINANTFTGANAATNFVGWNTAEDGSGTDYAPGAEITLSDDIVLYAQWFRFSPQGSQTPTVVVGQTKQGYLFIFTSTKNLNITKADFEVTSDHEDIATATVRDLNGGVRIDVHGVAAGTTRINVKFKGREGTLYGETTAYVDFTVKAADINTDLLTIEDQQVFELNNTDKNFRGYEWINIANQSDRISLEDGSNTNAPFTQGATYISDDRYFYLHAGSGDRLEDSGFDGLKLNGNPSASSGHYLEMDVHGSGKLTLQVWNNNDRTIVISSSNTFDDASIIATQEHTASTEVKTYEIIVNNQGTRHLFLGSKGGALRIGTFKWEPFAKPLLSISPASATIDVNDASKKVSDLTTMTAEIESTHAAIANPVYKYRSSNPEIATVDENTGAITPVAVGQTTITIQLQSDGETHGAQTAVLALTVQGTKKQNVTMSFSGNLAFTTADAIPTVPELTIKDENGDNLTVAVTYSIEAGTTGLSIDASTGALSGTHTAGTATVTATFSGNDTYNSATAIYTITITAEKVVAPVITLTADGGESTYSVVLKTVSNLPMTVANGSKSHVDYNDATEVYVLKNYLNDDKKSTKNNVYVAIETAQANATIKYYTSNSPANDASTFNSENGKVYETPVSMTSDKDRFISIEVTVGSEKWYGYYKLTSIPEPTITPDGENAAGHTNRNVTVSTSVSGGTLYYTLDGSDATTASNAYSSPINLTESKVVKAAAVYPGSLFADGNNFSTINVVNTVFIYDPTIFMADASGSGMAKAIKNGYKHELNGGKLVVTFGNNGKYCNSEGEYKESLLNAYATEKVNNVTVLKTDENGNYYEGDQEATNESGSIPSYVDVYTDRQMFNGDNPKREDGGYANMGEENGGTLFKTPVGGVMYRFEPTSNGVVTFWARQNGSLQYEEKNKDNADRGFSISRRPVYIMDEDGVYLRRNTNEEFTDIKQINGVEAHISNLSTFGTDPANAMNFFKENHPDNANYKYFADKYGDNIKATDKIGDIIYSETEAEAGGVPMYGWECPEKNYVRYSFPVKAGKTYYLGGKATKVGFCAVKFDAIETNSTNVAIDHKSTVGLPSMTVGQQYNVTLNRKFTANKWNALVLPFSVSETQLAEVFGEGVEVMFFENMPDNNTFKVLRHFYQMVYANVPCLVRPKNDVENPTFTNVTYAGGVIREQNIGYDYMVTGSYKKTVVKQYDYVTSWDEDHALTFFQATSPTEANRAWNATRGWITSNSAQNAPRVMSIGLGAYDGDDDEATYIETIFNGSILDGSYAPANNVRAGVYNISGQKIADTADNLPAGIYVVNGKKVIVK